MTDARHDLDAEELESVALEALAAAHATPPPAELRAQVLAGVRRVRAERLGARRLNRWRSIGIAASAAAATLGWFVVYQALEPRPLADLQVERTSLLTRLEQRDRDLRLLEDALRVHSEVTNILTSTRFVSAMLTAPDGGNGMARVLLDPATGALAVLGKGLPAPQVGRVYELWAIRADGTPEPAGTLEPGLGRSFAVRLRQVSEPSDVEQFALSVEPAGGAERPTGPVVLAGKVQR